MFSEGLCKHRELKNTGVLYLHQVCSLLETFQCWTLIILLVRCELQNPEVRIPEHLLNWCLCEGPTRSLVPVLLSGQFLRHISATLAAGSKHASALTGWDLCLQP